MGDLITLAVSLLLLSGCGASVGGGARLRSLPREGPVYEGSVTAAAGLAAVEDGNGVQVLVPLQWTLGTDRRSALQSRLETGAESTLLFHRVGFHSGLRLGVAVAGASGTYLGVRLGPSLMLTPAIAEKWAPSLSLCGMAAYGLGGDVGGHGLASLQLELSWDRYGSPIRIP
jgi:hypothetical protein